VTSTIYLDTVKKVARASITGTAQPSVPAKLLAHLKLIIKFFGADGVIAVDADTPTCVIKPKLAPTGAPSLIDTTAVSTGTGATSQYVFEWASADSTTLRAVMDATGDPTQPVELRCEVEYELDGNLERIAFPILFETSYTRPEDPAPEANTDSSWEWLKLRAPEANGFSHDDVERELTVAGGAGSGDVVGPASATDNALVRYDGTTGKLIQNGQVTQSDTGDLSAINSMTMDTTPTGSLAAQGQMMWNADEETLDIQLNGFALHVGEHVVYHVQNSTGSTIAKGVPVMFAGTTGNSGKLLIQPWNGTSPATLFMGLTAESLTTGSEGFVIAFGKLRGIQTNGANYGQTWVDGEIIYAGTTTGSLTKTQPSAPNPIVQVLAVVHAHASNGTYFIRPNYILGDVFGPASSTDNALVRFDSTTGKLIQNSIVTANDNGTIAATQLFCTSGSGQDALVRAEVGTSSVSITTEEVIVVVGVNSVKLVS
jgi:hypothetical protein